QDGAGGDPGGALRVRAEADRLHDERRGGRRVRMLRAVFADTRVLLRAAEHLPVFDRPALIVWARDDRVMPLAHGRRLAELLPQGRLVEIEDSYTLVPLDQPTELASAVREFTCVPGPDPRW
ncbi:alpha/beta hydrolase, partial [Streptomyces sp. NPDC005373]|uniref:alpha/beta fold hydrolase n=1 Tax=Streptomyces sp. NPDC005373 TaxID=3156879 RepID=UPI0033ABB8CB